MKKMQFIKGSIALSLIQMFPLSGIGQNMPNILILTVDDMSYNSPGIYGCKIKNITPNIDQLAREGMLFHHAHTTCAVCMPSRMSIMTGMYPHASGADGFEPVNANVETLPGILHQNGYFNGVMGKEAHMLPVGKYCWDYYIGSRTHLGKGREPSLYYKYSKEFFEKAKSEGKPFFLMANSDDPHDPFAGDEREVYLVGKGEEVSRFSRRISPNQVSVPGCLPDLKGVREDLAAYYTSVHRSDQTVGEVLRALKESGLDKNTVILFMSDNGLAFLFSKETCYREGTRMPFIVRWPGVVKPASIDSMHFISFVDIMPTVLDITNIAKPGKINGRSLLPILKGNNQTNREYAFTEFSEAGGYAFHPEHIAYPMRAVQNKDYIFIINYWADGERSFKGGWNPYTSTRYIIEEIAFNNDKKLLNRYMFFLHRTPEEFYDLKKDPECLNNLANEPGYVAQKEIFRKILIDQMKNTGDPALKPTVIGTPEAYEEFTQWQRVQASKTPQRIKELNELFPVKPALIKN